MIKAILFALLAAIGNAFFVYGQRDVEPSTNPFLFTTLAILVCCAMFMITSYLFKTPDDLSYAVTNYKNVLISGVGFFITFIGFFLLFSNYSASHYTLYAVISIITTSIVVGTYIFKEPMNKFHLLALVFALVTIVFFGIGQRVNK